MPGFSGYFYHGSGPDGHDRAADLFHIAGGPERLTHPENS